MNKSVMISIIAISVFVVGLALTIGSYFLESLFILLMGVLLILIGIFSYIMNKALSLFVMDRELNIEALKKAGLTIVTCNNCLKDNVLEDQYCVHCGERLGNDNEIQEEYKA
jgi:hypothetical protein